MADEKNPSVVDHPTAQQQQPAQQQEVQLMAIPAPLLQATIELIDNEVNGKKGRRICNMLEQAKPVNIQGG